MTEPQGLAFGKTAAPTIAPMPIAQAVPGHALVPFTMEEATQLGKTTGLAVAGIADKITGVARSGDIDELGKSLGGLLMTAKQYDPSQFTKSGGFLKFLGLGSKIQEIKNHFATIDSQVDTLLSETDKRISLFSGRIGDLKALYAENEQRYHEAGDAIVDIDRRTAWMEANKPAVDAGDSFSAQHLADWNAVIDYAKKRADDLRRVQVLCQQQGPQIQLMGQNSGALVMKFGEIRAMTIPVLKNAFALYILNIEQEKGAKFAEAIDDMTNQTLMANSAKLGQTTVAVQQTLSRSTIDLATLQKTQADTIKALDDVQRIRADMQTRLAAERPQLEALSQQLAQRLGQ